jgi:hypothetical protein
MNQIKKINATFKAREVSQSGLGANVCDEVKCFVLVTLI